MTNLLLHFIATFRKIDKYLGDWIEKGTEVLVIVNANDEEIPGVVVSGDILPGAQISGTTMADGEQNANLIDMTPGTKSGSRKASNDSDKKEDGGNFHDKLHAVHEAVENAHLSNVVAKGFHSS